MAILRPPPSLPPVGRKSEGSLPPRTNATMMPSATHHGLPADYFDQPLIRSYAETDARGNLFRVEVRGPEGGHKVQARFPMPHKVGGPEHRRGALTFSNA